MFISRSEVRNWQLIASKVVIIVGSCNYNRKNQCYINSPLSSCLIWETLQCESVEEGSRIDDFLKASDRWCMKWL